MKKTITEQHRRRKAPVRTRLARQKKKNEKKAGRVNTLQHCGQLYEHKQHGLAG